MNYVHPRFRWLVDLYWRGIPLTCRSCDDFQNCRKSFWKGRKCISGCIKRKRKDAYLRELDRKDYIDNLVKGAKDK